MYSSTSKPGVMFSVCMQYMDSTLKLPLQHKVNMELGGRRSYIKIAEVEVPDSNPGYPHAGIPGVGRAHCLILHDIKARLLKKF